MKRKFRANFSSFIKWFYPGMRIKRWIILLILGVLLITTGLARLITINSPLLKYIYFLDVMVGIWLIFQAVKKILRSIISIFLPQREDEFVDIAYHRRQLVRGPKIVVVGGGTGLSTILYGLKEVTTNISAIVTVADDGGSSGKLMQQFDILPPGDIRNCLVALADTEPLMRRLFQFRFDQNSEFKGHNFGNLFITVMTQLTGDFEQAIKASSKVLAIRGEVIPSTLNKVILCAKYKDGSLKQGEAAIPKAGMPIEKVFLSPEDSIATPEAVRAIEGADIIVLGPGSLYTSIIPNLLIKGIREAIVKSMALKFYICNIMTQQGETNDFSAYDHLNVLIEHSDPKIVDHCIVNNGIISQSVLDKYKETNSALVDADLDRIRSLGCKVLADNLVSADNVVRHDAQKLTKIMMKVFNSSRRRKI